MEDVAAGSPPSDEAGPAPEVDLEGEVVRLQAEVGRTKGVRARRMRQVATAVLCVLTTISVIASTLAFWGHRTVFDEDRYMAVAGPLGNDPAVTAAVSTYLSNQIIGVLDLKTRISDALDDIPAIPDRAHILIGPVADAVAGAAESRIRQRVDDYVHSPEFYDLWLKVNRVGHQKVVALLRGDYDQLPNVKVGDAEVRLNLVPILAPVLRNLVQEGVADVAPGVKIPDVKVTDVPAAARQRIAQALGVTVPPNFGEVTIMSRQQLDTLQGAVDRLDRLVWGLILLSLLLVAATVLVSVNRRRGLVEVATSVVVGLLLGTIVIRRVKAAVLDRVKAGQNRGAARVVMDDTLASLRSVAIVVIVVAFVVAVVAYLAGRPRWLTASIEWVRRQVTSAGNRAWIAAHADPLRIGVVAVGVLILFFTGISVLSLLVIGALVGLAVWAIQGVRHAVPPPPNGEGGTDTTAIGAR